MIDEYSLAPQLMSLTFQSAVEWGKTTNHCKHHRPFTSQSPTLTVQTLLSVVINVWSFDWSCGTESSPSLIMLHRTSRTLWVDSSDVFIKSGFDCRNSLSSSLSKLLSSLSFNPAIPVNGNRIYSPIRVSTFRDVANFLSLEAVMEDTELLYCPQGQSNFKQA